MNIYVGQDYSAMQGPCPTGFHVPLSTEWQSIYDVYTGLGLSGGTNFATYLKMPMAGVRTYSSLSFFNRGSYGYYWSSTPYNSDYAYFLGFGTSTVAPQKHDFSRANGFSVRCIQNSPTIPTSSWTVLYQGSGSAGIFYNPTDGLISLSSNGSTWYTLMDKNLGATTVYNYGDTLTEFNCGKVYQRGNNYGFSGDENYNVSKISQSGTQVNVTGYGPGNYYNSSTWITTSPRQSSANDGNNLRGGVTGVKPGEVKNIYIGEVYSGPLRFTANTANSTVQLTKNGSPTEVTLETSTDGTTWTTYTFGSTITLSNIGDKVSFRNTSTTATGFSTSTSNYYQFVMTGSIDADGNCNTLLKKDGLVNGLVGDYCYSKLFFNCSSLMKSPKLPATILTQYCYFGMFYMCGISEMPSLPATTLADYCYCSMFSSCSNLEKTSSLPATTLADYCYYNMFYGCTSLTTPPKLSATTLANYCYGSMFYGCTSLTTVPALPATSLATSCYQMMFINCSSLVELPKLSATTLPEQCYNNMFNGCSKIKLSTSQTGEYQTAYRIPTTGTGSEGSNSLYRMFYSIGGPFTGTPSINTTYYTSNTVV